MTLYDLIEDVSIYGHIRITAYDYENDKNYQILDEDWCELSASDIDDEWLCLDVTSLSLEHDVLYIDLDYGE